MLHVKAYMSQVHARFPSCSPALAPAAQVMQKFTNSDKFGLEIVVPKGYLPSEKDVTFDVPAMDFPLYCKRPALHN